MNTNFHSQDPQNYVYRVEGVSCTQCIAKIRGLSKSHFDIDDLKFNLAHKTLTITADQGFSGEKYIAALDSLGYAARDITRSETTESLNYDAENRQFLIRLGVAGACAGNSMLVSFALFLGAENTIYAAPLAWLSVLLYLPALFYSGFPILQRSFVALKNLNPSVDLPIALALIVGGGLSLKNVIQNNPNIYFDSLSGLIFFLLCTRYLVFQIKNKFLTPLSMAEILPSQTAWVKRSDHSEFQEASILEIQSQDQVRLTSSEILPVDGSLMSETAEFDTSLLTGESFPVTLKKYDRVISGSKLLSKEAIILAQSQTKESRIHEIFNRLNDALTEKTELITFTDKAAQVLTYVILSTAALFLTFYTSIPFDERLHRVLALLVIACPCALAIATPLALSLGVKKLFHKDILIKNPDSFEKLGRITTVVFDKTGTLTQSTLQVTDWSPRRPTAEEERIIYALEKHSEHPIAKALLRSVNSQSNASSLNLEVTESIGQGVEALHEGHHYALKKSSTTQGQVVFCKDNAEILYIHFSSELQNDAFAALEFLNSKSIKSYLLSGDNQTFSQQVGESLGFASSHILYDQTPESKAEFIEGLKTKAEKVLYVGDGLNDSIAMAKSDLSISVNNSVEATFKASDIHFNRSGISKISVLFQVSKEVLKTIKRNLVLSTCYNLTFGSLALSGVITPLLTAIIMPISAFTVVGMTFYFLYLKKDGK